MEGLGHNGQLRQLGQWLDARNDGNGDAHRPRLLHEREVFIVVKEQLGHAILRTKILFLFQILHVALQVRRLLMLLRIAGHTVVEGLARVLDGCAVGKEALVETLHLLNQFRGMGMASGGGYKTTVLLGLVTTEQEQVADAQELQIQQLVFDILNCGTTADHMWLHGDMVSLLDGSSNGDGSRTATDALPFKLPVLQFAIHEL